ncbi:class I SAM-dependent methyltransferase [Actinopolymorpha pittospori]
MAEPSTETQRTYDVIAPEYARHTSTVYPLLMEEVASLTAHLPLGGRVADVGCGPGREVGLLRAEGFTVLGLDLSLGQLRAGGLPGVAQADMRRLPVRSGSLDAVWCQAALLHIPRETVPTVLEEFGRTVRLGGWLYLAVAEGDGERWEVATNYGATTERRWFTFHRESDLRAMLGAAGFRVEWVGRHTSGRDWLSLHAVRVGSGS